MTLLSPRETYELMAGSLWVKGALSPLVLTRAPVVSEGGLAHLLAPYRKPHFFFAPAAPCWGVVWSMRKCNSGATAAPV